MYQLLTESDLRQMCRERIESLEYWLRRLIDVTLTQKFGDYFAYVDEKSNRLISNKIADAIKKRTINEPHRYGRPVDAILFEDAISIICNPQIYPNFSDALALAFPHGCDVARSFLLRLVEPRNLLAHANPISVRQAEQVVCYTNDVIDSIKAYYKSQNMSQEYNAPSILRYWDSVGNARHRNQCMLGHDGILLNFVDVPEYHFRPGDYFAFDVEVDAAFQSHDYEVKFDSVNAFGMEIKPKPGGCKVVVHFDVRHINANFVIRVAVTSSKSWHRYGRLDDSLGVLVRVLPPLNE
jgi:hypothetical protein